MLAACYMQYAAVLVNAMAAASLAPSIGKAAGSCTRICAEEHSFPASLDTSSGNVPGQLLTSSGIVPGQLLAPFDHYITIMLKATVLDLLQGATLWGFKHAWTCVVSCLDGSCLAVILVVWRCRETGMVVQAQGMVCTTSSIFSLVTHVRYFERNLSLKALNQNHPFQLLVSASHSNAIDESAKGWTAVMHAMLIKQTMAGYSFTAIELYFAVCSAALSSSHSCDVSAHSYCLHRCNYVSLGSLAVLQQQRLLHTAAQTGLYMFTSYSQQPS